MCIDVRAIATAATREAVDVGCRTSPPFEGGSNDAPRWHSACGRSGALGVTPDVGTETCYCGSVTPPRDPDRIGP